MGTLVKRHLKMYFRDRVSVFFSLLAVLIVIALYALFLARLQADAVREASHGMLSDDVIDYLINSWILAGLLAVTTVTSTLGAYGTMVVDYEQRKIMDFKSSPLGRMRYPLSHLLAAFLIGTIMSVSAFLLYLLFIRVQTGFMIPWRGIAEALAYIVLAALMNASLMGLMSVRLRTVSAFSSVSLVVGTIIGFLNGLYVPMGTLPKAARIVIKALPFGHSASLFRQALTEGAIQEAFSGMPGPADEYREFFGVILTRGGEPIGKGLSILYLLGVAGLSLGLFFIVYNRQAKEI